MYVWGSYCKIVPPCFARGEVEPGESAVCGRPNSEKVGLAFPHYFAALLSALLLCVGSGLSPSLLHIFAAPSLVARGVVVVVVYRLAGLGVVVVVVGDRGWIRAVAELYGAGAGGLGIHLTQYPLNTRNLALTHTLAVCLSNILISDYRIKQRTII